MNKIKIILILIASIGFLSSCELDNYEGPNAGLYGSIIDAETGELVEQDIIRGAVIEIREHGYDPVSPQYLVIKNDGTYENSRLFANTYTVQPVRANFKPVDPQEVKIKGQTKLDFMVTPYIRVKDVEITQSGNKIVATFKLEQTSVSNVSKIGLYAHPDPHVGEPMQIAKVEQNIHAIVDQNQIYTLELDTTTDPDLSPGTQYFFRVGALIDVPEAKFNYAPAVSITI